MLDTFIKIKTDNFDGPMGLLLLLIQKEEMKIQDLDLTKITKQYLDYLEQMEELNFDVAGDYLYFAATLLLIKSKNCLTEEDTLRLNEEFGGDNLQVLSQADLISRLEQLQHYQGMGQKLWDLPKAGHEVFTKPKVNRKAIINSILAPMDKEKLTGAMMDYLFKEKRKFTVVKRDRLSIKEKLAFLKDYLEVGKQKTFDTILKDNGDEGISNKVITLISLLELARLNKIKIFQNKSFDNIFVDVMSSLDDFNIDSANGFEDEDEEKENVSISASENLEEEKDIIVPVQNSETKENVIH